MAIAFDAVSTNNTNNSGTVSHNHTCTGSELYLFAVTHEYATAVTYNGVSLVLLDSYNPGTSNNAVIKIWGLSNPSTGENTIQLTASGGTPIVVVSYSGCGEIQPEPPLGNYGDSNNNQIVTWSTAVTTVREGCWAVSFLLFNNSISFTAGASTTRRGGTTGSINSYSAEIYDSNGIVSPPAQRTLAMDIVSGTAYMTSIAFSIQPPITISVNDSISITESVNMEFIYTLSVNDAISITESVNAEYVVDIIVNDSVSITESVTVENPNLGGISVSDTVAITELTLGDYYPSILSGFEEMLSDEDNLPLGMDDDTIL